MYLCEQIQITTCKIVYEIRKAVAEEKSVAWCEITVREGVEGYKIVSESRLVEVPLIKSSSWWLSDVGVCKNHYLAKCEEVVIEAEVIASLAEEKSVVPAEYGVICSATFESSEVNLGIVSKGTNSEDFAERTESSVTPTTRTSCSETWKTRLRILATRWSHLTGLLVTIYEEVKRIFILLS